jgi:hypothetical protein
MFCRFAHPLEADPAGMQDLPQPLPADPQRQAPAR